MLQQFPGNQTRRYTDRGNKRTTIAGLRLRTDYTPESLTIEGRPNSAIVRDGSAEVHEDAKTRTFAAPPAIQCATIVSLRAMGLDRDSGTVEVGKRADLIQVDGDPLADIRELRKVSRVAANGRLYDSGKSWRSAGFRW